MASRMTRGAALQYSPRKMFKTENSYSPTLVSTPQLVSTLPPVTAGPSVGDLDFDDFEEIVYRCKICSAEFSQVEDLRNHVLAVHTPAIRKATPQGTPIQIVAVPLEEIRDYKPQQYEMDDQDLPSAEALEQYNIQENEVLDIEDVQNQENEERFKQEISDNDDNIDEEDPKVLQRCRICNIKCQDKASLAVHLKVEHGIEAGTVSQVPSTSYVCILCSVSYAWRKTLMKHLMQVHSIASDMEEYIAFGCDLCQEKPFSYEELQVHKKDVHGIEMIVVEDAAPAIEKALPYGCNRCNKRYTSTKRFLNHVQSVHGIEWDVEDSQDVLLILSSFLQDPDNLLKMRSVHGDSRKVVAFACGICDSNFANRSDLKTHKLEAHNVLPASEENPHGDEPAGSQIYQCIVCQKKYRFKKSIRKHVREAHMPQLIALVKNEGQNVEQLEMVEKNEQEIKSEEEWGEESQEEEQEENMESSDVSDNDESHVSQGDGRDEMFKCRLCPKFFKTRQQLAEHKGQSHRSSALELLTGQSRVVEEVVQQVIEEEEEVDQEESYTADEAVRVDTRITDQLMVSGIAENLHPCTLCDSKFRYKKRLQHHLAQEHGIKPEPGMDKEVPTPTAETEAEKSHQCDKCDKKYMSVKSLRQHMRTAHQDYSIQFGKMSDEKAFPYHCTYCKKRFVWYKSLRRHVQVEHGEDMALPSGRKSIMTEPPSYQCLKCQRKMHREETLYRHYHQVHNLPIDISIVANTPLTKDFVFKNRIVFVCTSCSLVFGCQKDLRRHYRNDHQQDKAECMFAIIDGEYSSLMNKKTYACSFCDKEFFRFDSCRNHEHVMHLGRVEKKHKCPFCDHRSFITQANLERHINLHHTKSITYSCPHCPKTFYAPDYVTAHVKGMHAEIKPWTCRVCSKGFCTVTRRNNHELIHNKQKAFQCQFCGKEFAARSSVKIHENNVHLKNNITDYRCDGCSKYFRTPERLERHLCSRRLTGQCRFCSKEFTSVSSCRRHEKFHTGENMFKCKFCPKQFTAKQHLRRHEETHDRKKGKFTVKSMQGLDMDSYMVIMGEEGAEYDEDMNPIME